jgi:hypothetical protein
MKKADVKVGEVYAVKVSGNMAPVVIDEEHPKGGWNGTNQETNRQVRIKTAQRLRCPWDDYLTGGHEGEEEPEGKPKAKKADKEATRANTVAPGKETAEPSSKEAKPKKKRTGAKTGEQGEKPMSGLDAAAKVLAEAGEPLNCKAIVERAFEAGYWRSDGKTPAATVYAAILREMQNKGDESRFVKAGRGLFALAE